MEKLKNVPNENFELLDGGYSNYEGALELPRHRWYYYKEGFSPFLVEKAIEHTGIGKDEIIIDPFNGSGTTTLTSSINGYKSIGIEVNPFTSFLSEVKITNGDVAALNRCKKKVLKALEIGALSPLVGFSTFSQTKQLEKWLFNDSILNSFEAGWQLTNSISSYNIRRLVRLALISSTMQNCNAKRDGKCLRYRESWEKNKFDKYTLIAAFDSDLSNIVEDIRKKPISGKAIIINGDCREILKSSSKIKKFKLCITSPPYLNTFDYTDIYRPELFLGKFINNADSLYRLRLNTVRSHVQAKWREPEQNDFGLLYAKTMIHINNNKEFLMHKNIPIMIQAYFEDMLNILKLLKTKAAKDAQIWFVVSNSAYAGHEVPVDLIIGDLAIQAGWFLKDIAVLRYLKKRKSKYSAEITQLRESAIILTNEKF